MIGAQRVCLDFIRDPGFISYMFSKLADYLVECAKSLLDAGVDGL